MTINANKSQLMVLLPPKDKSTLKLTLGTNIISHQDNIKILGLTLSASMKFDTHLWAGKNSMTQAINSKVALLKTVKPYISTEALGIVGASLINSTILYAAPLWGPTSKTNLDKVQKGQTIAARMVKGKAWQRTRTKQHRQQLFDELNWPNTVQIIYTATANLTKAALDKNSSEALNNMFKVTKSTLPRKATTIRIDHRGKHSKANSVFSVNATSIYNNLPNEIKDPSLTAKQFKSKLKILSRTKNLLPMH